MRSRLAALSAASSRDAGDRTACVGRTTLRLLPVLLAAERAQVEEVVRAAEHLFFLVRAYQDATARVLLATTGQRGGGYTSTTRVLRDTDKPSEAARLIQDRLPEYRDWVRWWTSLRIVDGGALSNFPVWIFDVEDRDALRPTFGFRLVGGKGVGGGLEGVIHTLGWAAEMGADIFHTATDA